MTPLRVSIFAAIAALILLAVVFELMRSRRLQERYALLWLASAIVLLGLAVWRDALGTVADWMGISYPPNALFFIAFGFILLLLLHFSAAVSRLADQSKMLAQRVALLEQRVGENEKHLTQPGEAGDESWREVAEALVEERAPAQPGLRR